MSPSKSRPNQKDKKDPERRGGLRNPPGGRPRKEPNVKQVERMARDVRDRAAYILESVDKDINGNDGEVQAWAKLLNSRDLNIRLRARIELSKLAYPAPKQVDAKVAGTVTIIFTAPPGATVKVPKWVKHPTNP